jgi:hypothetical protein
MRKLMPILLAVGMMVFGALTARAESSVQIFFVACDTQAVLNFSGTMDSGFDIFYQVFSGAGGTGSALTSVRHVPVSTGQYAVSDQVAYNSGSTVPAGGTASAKVYISREGTSGTSTTPFVVNDAQDGCNSPQNQLVSSTDTGGDTSTTTTTVGGSNILSPFGGVINPGVSVTPEPIVVIGARTNVNPLRSATAGVIFAECDQYLPGAAPGVLYNTDNIVIFWSWFAKTEKEVQDHIAQAQYDVKLDTAPLVDVVVSPVTRPKGRNFWVFYTATIGHLSPGTYGVEFNLTWNQAISDGYANYGPDTDNEAVHSTCTFTIEPNPDGTPVTDTNRMYSLQK